MLSQSPCYPSIKSDKLTKQCQLNNKDFNERFVNMKSMDITSRLGQFAWRQIIPSNIILPVIFRNVNREEYLCVQMIKIHLLSRLSSERMSLQRNKSPLNEYSLTICEAELFDHINKFHSNRILSNNNNSQLNYSQLDSISLTPFNSFIKFYQIIYSTYQFIHSNQLSISTLNKSITDKEKQITKNMFDSTKNVLSKRNERTSESFCREIIFHGKEILSYCTTSSIDSNEKANQTISCLSIKDILLNYFPWISIEQFIQICRQKQITRFKPDKSTDCDSTLRLINIKQLEHHWNFIIKELLPNKQIYSNHQNDQSEKEKCSIQIPSTDMLITKNSNDTIISNTNDQQIITTVQLPLKETLIDNSISNDNQYSDLLDNCQERIKDSHQTSQLLHLEEEQDKEELSFRIEEDRSSNCKSLKRRRRRHRTNYSSSKRKRNNEQFWMKKYSIEPFSIIVDRYKLS